MRLLGELIKIMKVKCLAQSLENSLRLKKWRPSQAPVAHACNANYLGG
jgi:hypothetical protein